MRAGGAALVADLPATVAAVVVGDGDPAGWLAGPKLHAELAASGRPCYGAALIGGDLDELLRGADLAERHAERAAIREHDGGMDRAAATACALARLLETLTPIPEAT